VTRAWVVPLGGQLDLLARWLEPMLDRPGLVPVPAAELRVVIGAGGDEGRTIEFEPFDALVGPVRVDEQGIVADVIPVEPFLALRALVGATAGQAPRVVFARADGTERLEQIEAVASEAVYVDELVLVELS
jgi:hypothetical protein